MNPLKLTALTLVTAFGLTTIASAKDGALPPASTKKDVTYATDIKPIFEASCLKCHDSKKEKQGAKLCLDTLAGVLKGAKHGKVVVPGDSAKSELVLSVAHVGDPDTFKPKKAKKLSDEKIALIRAWIDQGAK